MQLRSLFVYQEVNRSSRASRQVEAEHTVTVPEIREVDAPVAIRAIEPSPSGVSRAYEYRECGGQLWSRCHHQNIVHNADRNGEPPPIQTVEDRWATPDDLKRWALPWLCQDGTQVPHYVERYSRSTVIIGDEVWRHSREPVYEVELVNQRRSRPVQTAIRTNFYDRIHGPLIYFRLDELPLAHEYARVRAERELQRRREWEERDRGLPADLQTQASYAVRPVRVETRYEVLLPWAIRAPRCRNHSL